VILADTDVLIDGLRGREPSRSHLAGRIEAGSLATTVITLFELLAGARQRRERDKVNALLAALTILPVDAQAAREAASIQLRLARRGETIGMADSLVAGVCLAHQASLLTRNREHFGRVPGLVLADS